MGKFRVVLGFFGRIIESDFHEIQEIFSTVNVRSGVELDMCICALN